MSKDKETKKRLDAEELEKRDAPFAIQYQEDVDPGTGGTSSPETSEPTSPTQPGGGRGGGPKVDVPQ